MVKKKLNYYVYMLECSDHSLYTGYSPYLEKRIALHQEGKAAKYTRSRRPVKLVHFWTFTSKSQALQVEAFIKKRKRTEKLAFISTCISEDELLKRVEEQKK